MPVLVRWDRHTSTDTFDNSPPDGQQVMLDQDKSDWHLQHEPREINSAEELNAVFAETCEDLWFPRCTITISTHPADGEPAATLTFTARHGPWRSKVQWTGGSPQLMQETWISESMTDVCAAAHRFRVTGGACPDNLIWRRPGQTMVQWTGGHAAIDTVEELDALLDELDAESRRAPLPDTVFIESPAGNAAGDPDRGNELIFTVGTRNTPVTWCGTPGERCSWNGGLDEEPYFVTDWGGQRNDLPAWMPIPMAEAREGARQFLATGGRCPDNITWEPDPKPNFRRRPPRATGLATVMFFADDPYTSARWWGDMLGAQVDVEESAPGSAENQVYASFMLGGVEFGWAPPTRTKTRPAPAPSPTGGLTT